MTKRFALRAALAALALTLTAGTAFAATAVAKQGVNIRAAASTDSRIIGQLAAGEEVEVIECGGGWCALEDGGYVAQSYLVIAGVGGAYDEEDDALDDEDDDGPVTSFDPEEGEFDDDPLGFEDSTPQSIQEPPEDDEEDDEGDEDEDDED